jgi:hypothetical protein
VIKTSALLVVVAIGMLVAGVLASSLMMVYLSIGVCAVAALLLVVGVLTHWSEIFGRGEARPASLQESWAAPQVQVRSPVLAAAQATDTRAAGSRAAGTRTTGAQVPGPQAPAAPGREERRSRREDSGGRPPVPPVQVTRPAAEFPAAGRSEDLWERVEEELGSAGKRDTGALSWPATEIPVFREAAEPAGPPQQASEQAAPPPGTQAWIWGSGAAWQPPEAPDPAWPPPAAAFAGRPPGRESVPSGADRAEDEGSQSPDQEPGIPEAAAGPVPDAEAVPDADQPGPADEAAHPVPDSAPAKTAAWDERPQWIISVGDTPARPVRGSAVAVPAPSEPAAEPVSDEPASGEPEAAAPGTGEPGAGEPEAGEPEAGEPASGEPEAAAPGTREPGAGEPEAGEPQAGKPGAGEKAGSPRPAAPGAGAGEPAGQKPAGQEKDGDDPAGQEPAAEAPAGEAPAAGAPAGTAGPGRVEVTVVPGVARYHRRECILIRFLGAGDLEIMTRQEAEEAKFAACRACQPDLLEA